MTDTALAAPKAPRKPRALPMSVCQSCAGGKAPKGGGQVVCLSCSASPPQPETAAAA